MASILPQTTLAARASGAGTTIDFVDARSRVSIVVTQSGLITEGLVAMEASHDGTNWVVIAVLDVGFPGNQFYSATNGAFRFWRANVVRNVTGGTVTATLMEADR